MTKVLIIGGGAREEAIAHTLKQDTEIFSLPGNAGSENQVEVSTNSFSKIKDTCKRLAIDAVIVGPEQALADGIVDYLEDHGIFTFGAHKKASILESSKTQAKNFMTKYGIQTAAFFATNSKEKAKQRVKDLLGKCVVKWDGLAAGKGVVVCDTINEGFKAIDELSSKYGTEKLVIEERLYGRELSVFIITDGKHAKILPVAQDYKRAFDKDLGPNTGGMGAVSCDSLWDQNLKKLFNDKILEPTLTGIQKENISYKGFLFFGLMIQNDQPYLLEYNVRLGDPESSAVLARLESSLWNLIFACKEEKLEECDICWSKDSAVNVVLSSQGYPNSYKTGFEIFGLDKVDKKTKVFHAGTNIEGKKILTSGGRVLNLTTLGNNIEEARQKVYRDINKIKFEGKSYRTDIGIDLENEKNSNTYLGAWKQHDKNNSRDKVGNTTGIC